MTIETAIDSLVSYAMNCGLTQPEDHIVVVNKLLDRGSLCATTIVTNVQDFITIIAKGLGVID